MSRRLQREEYTVGWICALPIELAAAQEMLDEEHEDFKRDAGDNDENLYSLGSISGHNVVIVCLPEGRIGNNPAAAVATRMRATFKGIRFGLMVGIGGGVPSAENDIRLGDVVVGRPQQTFAGVVQYDFGKATPSGFQQTGSLNSPPQILLGAVAKVRANYFRGRSELYEHITRLERIPTFQRAQTGPDILFEATYDHEGDQKCDLCDTNRQENRQPHERTEVVVHYGTIASGNQVMRDGRTRDRVSKELGSVLCFEMEAAGLVNNFPCLVIRGICDYADSHKNKSWQPYAAGTAAAYAKEVLSTIPPVDVAETFTMKETIQTLAKRVTTPTYYIPFPENRYFVGRKDELDVLRQRLMVDRDCQKISVVGLGGTGKTQVALQFAYMVKKTWPEYSIFWIPALSIESFEQACADIVRALLRAAGEEDDKEVDAKEQLKQHLSTARAGRWLLVLDNADDPDILFGTGQSNKGIVDYLPESEEGVVVFTTRTLDVAVSLTRGDVIELEAMNQQDAIDFLEKLLIRKDLLRDHATTSDLLDELTCLPLAIAQAAAYLNMNRMSITKYLQLIRNTEQDIIGLMSKEFRDDTRYKDSANAVATTWVVSFSQIQERNSVAADLLAFMSCIEWKAIPRSLLPSIQPEGQMEDAIGALCAYSFLRRREDEDCFDIHRLVHLATRTWISQRGDMPDALKKAIRHVAQIFPSRYYADQAVWRAYLPHALQLLGHKQDSNDKDTSRLCLCVGRCLLKERRAKEAVRWLEESCRWRDRLEEEDSDRLTAQRKLAEAYESNRQVERALELLGHVIAVQKRILTEDDHRLLSSQHALARAYRADGRIKEAIELLEHVVTVQATLPEEDSKRLLSQHTLAQAYRIDGQVKKAIELLEHVVTVRRKLPEANPHRLRSQHALALAYEADGQVEEAKELLEHVVAIDTKVFQNNYPLRQGSIKALANLNAKLSRV